MPDRTEYEGTTDRASPADRTKVIILAQIVTIVALLVVWSIVRARRSNGEETG
jgi:heme/copper-type cytochrome/quinol oxidase subunit 2